VGVVSTTVDISAVNGVPVLAGGESSSVLTAVRKLRSLQGVMKPLQIASSTPLPGLTVGASLPGYTGLIHLAFTQPADGGAAHTAGVASSGLSPAQWLALVARLGEVPDPAVSSKPSSAAIPDSSSAAPAVAEGN
jgi:hypothetical protein